MVFILKRLPTECEKIFASYKGPWKRFLLYLIIPLSFPTCGSTQCLEAFYGYPSAVIQAPFFRDPPHHNLMLFHREKWAIGRL
jgi:hypothetical protein